MRIHLTSNALRFLTLLCLGVFLSACAETQFLVHTAKVVNQQSKDGDNTSTSSSPYGDGIYKIGNPYQIYNVWYYPELDYEYDETGIASWYGEKFHGRKTANGEIYNMNDLTAAHKTLPLPSWVEVTNLDNGRKIKFRLNDRGPYAKGRIIDISRQGAQLLGFKDQGIAKVRVKILADESRQVAALMRGEATIQEFGSPITVDSLPKDSVNTESLAPPPGATVAETEALPPQQVVVASNAEPEALQLPSNDITVESVPVGPTNIYIQAGSFTNYENALRAKSILSQITETEISQILVNNTDFFRVRIGPLPSVEQADIILDQALASGYPDSRIIID